MNFPSVPHLKTTLSHVSPDKAAEIRSAVTGCLKHSNNGLFCFEQTVETTFLLPWDLDPKVQPQKLSVAVRDGIRAELLDSPSLQHLEACGSINWNSTVLWQCRSGQGLWEPVGDALSAQLEEGYLRGPNQCTFVVSFSTFQVDFATHQMFNTSSNSLFELRRLAFAPLMPMKTEQDVHSLFHAASLGFWGVHDRTSVLSEAVSHTLSNPKAQFLIYDYWSDGIARETPAGAKPEFPQWEAAKRNLAEAPQLHIFTLANVVQRPILVYAHPDSPVGGIYLPLLWVGPGGKFLSETHPHLRNPLALGYDATCRHFTPLVTFKGVRGPHPILYPLMHCNGCLFKIHYLSQKQSQEDPTLLLSRLMLLDVIGPSQPPIAPQSLQTHTVFGGSSAPLFGKTASTPGHESVSPVFPPTLAAISMATELPEVMDMLIKRYQSTFL